MNVTAIRLIFVRTNTGFVVMCKILLVVVAFFECTRVNSTFLGRNSLPLVLIYMYVPYYLKLWSALYKCLISFSDWGKQHYKKTNAGSQINA